MKLSLSMFLNINADDFLALISPIATVGITGINLSLVLETHQFCRLNNKRGEREFAFESFLFTSEIQWLVNALYSGSVHGIHVLRTGFKQKQVAIRNESARFDASLLRFSQSFQFL